MPDRVTIETEAQAQTALEGVINGSNTTPFTITNFRDRNRNVRPTANFTPNGRRLTRADLEDPELRNVLRELASRANPRSISTLILQDALEAIEAEENIPGRQRFQRDLQNSQAGRPNVTDVVYNYALRTITESFSPPVVIATPAQAQTALQGVLQGANFRSFVLTLNGARREFSPDGNPVTEADLRDPTTLQALQNLAGQANPALASTRVLRETLRDLESGNITPATALGQIQTVFPPPGRRSQLTTGQEQPMASLPENIRDAVARLQEEGRTADNPSGTDLAVANNSERPRQLSVVPLGRADATERKM